MFEEWWEAAKLSGLVPMWDSNKHSALLAWKAATKAEREACASLCEEFDSCDTSHITRAIRARSGQTKEIKRED